MTCYLTTFWIVLGLSEDVFWLRAQISPSATPCVLKREGEEKKNKKKTQSVTLQSFNTQAPTHVPTEPQTSTEQLNKWPQTGVEACLWGVGGENRKTADGGKIDSWKERERFKERVRETRLSEADKVRQGEGARCAESLLFSLTFGGTRWLVESKSVRWRFPVSWRSSNHSHLTFLWRAVAICHQNPGSGFTLWGPTRRQMCGPTWALLWRCVCVWCLWSAGSQRCGETAAVYIVRHCRCVVSWRARVHASGAH